MVELGSTVGLGLRVGTAGQPRLSLEGGSTGLGAAAWLRLWTARVKVRGGTSWIGCCSLVGTKDCWFGAAGVKAGNVGCNLRRGPLTRRRRKRSISLSYVISAAFCWRVVGCCRCLLGRYLPGVG